MGTGFRFLHCADLHIGSAFTGLGRRLPELDGRLAKTPFQAWKNTVRIAIEEKVDFLLISGDCFDRHAPSLRGRIEFYKGLEELDKVSIPVFIVSGNHDPFPQAWSKALHLPSNVTFFPTDKVLCHPFIKNGETVATIGGIGHSSLNVLDNLALQTGSALRECAGVKIALVHANLCGDPHAAPANSAELAALPVDYWALGHVHQRRVMNEYPFIVYSGCIQGKDIHEPGVQGCYVVEYDGFGKFTLNFHPTSVLEFESIDLNISHAENLETVVSLLAGKIAAVKGKNELLYRLKLSGVTPLDAELRSWNSEELRSHFYEEIKSLIPGSYLEEIFVLTQMPASENSHLLPAEELAAALQEITDEKVLESIYAEMQSVCRALPPLRAERFNELRQEGSALLAELLTGRLEL